MTGPIILCESPRTLRTHYLPVVRGTHWMHVKEPEKFTPHQELVDCPTCLRVMKGGDA